MAIRRKVKLHHILATIRFVQGYRYLDRCGELIVRIQKNDDSWLADNPNPQSGALNNWKLGMNMRISAEAMSLQQTEFLSAEHFRSQLCSLYDIVWTCFDIRRICTPSIRFIFQVGCDTLEESESTVQQLRFAVPDEDLVALLDGKPSSQTFVQCTSALVSWAGQTVSRRRRIELNSIRQEKQLPFDQRLMLRLPLLSLHDKNAMQDLLKLRRSHPSVEPFAAQFDFETSLEDEFDARHFDVGEFTTSAYDWFEACRQFVTTRLEKLLK